MQDLCIAKIYKPGDIFFAADSVKLLYNFVRIQYLKNAPTFASCSFDKRGLNLIIFGKQHQQIFKNDMHIQLSLSLHFYLLYLLLKRCDGNGAKQRIFLSRLFVISPQIL